MKPRGIALSLSLAGLGVLGLASGAQAAPVWNLDLHHNQTHFPPGGSGEYWVSANNVGDTDTSGPVTLKVTLPAGITRDSVRSVSQNDKGAFFTTARPNGAARALRETKRLPAPPAPRSAATRSRATSSSPSTSPRAYPSAKSSPAPKSKAAARRK